MLYKRIMSLFVACAFILNINVYGSVNDEGALVEVRIESYNKTIASNELKAHTFKDAIERITEKNYIDTDYELSAKKTAVTKIDSVANGTFGGQDKWLGYILRDGKVIMPENYLSENLQDGDIAVLFYGTLDDTAIVSQMNHNISGNTVSFSAHIEDSSWTLKDGTWIMDNSPKATDSGKLHLLLPNGNSKVMKLDDTGNTSTYIYTPGIYRYYAEFYGDTNIPDAVKTGERYFFYGLEDASGITRSEFAAFLVTAFDIKPVNTEFLFTDIEKNHKNYYYIKTASSAGIISGYSDNTLQPDAPVTLLQAAIMLSHLTEGKPAYDIEFDGPSWAASNVKKVIVSGLIDNIELDWERPVTESDLIRIYKNLNKS